MVHSNGGALEPSGIETDNLTINQVLVAESITAAVSLDEPVNIPCCRINPPYVLDWALNEEAPITYILKSETYKS
jgi:hypothetical protein